MSSKTLFGIAIAAIALQSAPASAQDTTTPAGTATAAAAPAIRVARVVMARGVTRRGVTGEATSFPARSGRVYAWLEIENPGRIETTVVVAWQRPGRTTAPNRGATLAVPAQRRYHTFAFVVPAEPGTWTAVVRSADGTELARQTFEITPAGSAAAAPPG